MRRRGKGEASFLHCKGRTGRHEQRKRDGRGERETKERRRRGKEVETEVGRKKMWERGGQNWEGKKKKKKKKAKRAVDRES